MKELCETCMGDTTIIIKNGIKLCPDCDGIGWASFNRKFTKGQRLKSMREIYEALLLGHKVQNDEDPGYFYFHEDDGFMSTEGNDAEDDHDRMSRNTLSFSYYKWWEILE